MKLVSFSVENYRSITKARRIKLDQKTILVGPNNEGKSNILRALNAAMQILTSPPRRLATGKFMARVGSDNYYDWKRDFPLSLQSSKKKNTIVSLEFELSPSEIEDLRAETKSRLNGTLPIAVTFSENYEVKIVKQGKGSASLNQKSAAIQRFIADRIQFQYVPAVRTADNAASIVNSIIASELREIESHPEYRRAMEIVRTLQKPILDLYAESAASTLQSFIPNFRSISFTIDEERRYSSLRQNIDIMIDDGSITSLASKGDGVQSLVALGLRRHVVEASREKRSFIFAIEEPEAHLHPNAVHTLRTVFDDIARVDQLVITTHSPQLVDRGNIRSNVIVRQSIAKVADNLSEIREALGIRSHDNLINAELILLVEGENDKRALTSLLMHRSEMLRTAQSDGTFVIESVDGAGSLASRVALYRSIVCGVHCFLDNDDAARSAIEKASRGGLLGDGDYNTAMLAGRANTEFEDLIDPSVYSDEIHNVFSVDLGSVRPRRREAKWSEKIADCFVQAGIEMDDARLQRVKAAVSECVIRSSDRAIADYAEPIIDTLRSRLEFKLRQTRTVRT